MFTLFFVKTKFFYLVGKDKDFQFNYLQNSVCGEVPGGGGWALELGAGQGSGWGRGDCCYCCRFVYATAAKFCVCAAAAKYRTMHYILPLSIFKFIIIFILFF